MSNQSTPPRWGKDYFTKYLDEVRNRQFITFSDPSFKMAKLITIDRNFHDMLHNTKDLKPWYPRFLLSGAHYAYRIAGGAAIAGQFYVLQAGIRACLEHGAYAIYIGHDHEKYAVWESRIDSEEAKNKIKKEFTYKKILKYISDIDTKLGQDYMDYYESTIDFGAHPAESMLLLVSKTGIMRDGSHRPDPNYWTDDEKILKYGINEVCNIGSWVLAIAQTIYSGQKQS